ncbi:MAG: hypothetical protein LZF86_190002 [Nitrospira sp.]|nr:MAG: hypothetical protein LZF86_190002 [Nitrospira sp.]
MSQELQPIVSANVFNTVSLQGEEPLSSNPTRTSNSVELQGATVFPLSHHPSPLLSPGKLKGPIGASFREKAIGITIEICS